MDYDVMAADIVELMDDLRIEKADILGHSMGGKTAMKFAMNHPERLNRLIVADISPKAYDHHHGDVLDALWALENTPDLDSRKKADGIVSEHIDQIGVRYFLLKNLYWKEKGKLELRVNLPGIADKMDEILTSLGTDEVRVSTLFLRGANSNYISDTEAENIARQFPNSALETISDAGHWLHAEQQDAFYNQVAYFLEF